jgi:positive regulator of sigma E activity
MLLVRYKRNSSTKSCQQRTQLEGGKLGESKQAKTLTCYVSARRELYTGSKVKIGVKTEDHEHIPDALMVAFVFCLCAQDRPST